MRTSRGEVPHQFAFGKRARGRNRLNAGDKLLFALLGLVIGTAAVIAAFLTSA